MKFLIPILTRVPIFILFIPYILPAALLWILPEVYESFNSYGIRIFQYAVITLWSLAMMGYVTRETESTKGVILANILICINFFTFGVFDLYELEENYDWIFYPMLIYFVLALLQAYLMTVVVKRLFYARSFWFLLVELFVYVIGLITLTQEVKRNERRKRMN